MKRLIFLVLGSCLLFGCGAVQRGCAIAKGHDKKTNKSGFYVCVEGVSYLQFPSCVTVQYNEDGKVVLCK